MQFIRMSRGYFNECDFSDGRLSWSNIFNIHIEDLLVYGKTVIEHDMNFGKLEEILRLYGLVENQKKILQKTRDKIF